MLVRIRPICWCVSRQFLADFWSFRFSPGDAEYATFSRLSSASAAAAFGGIETAECPGCKEVYLIEDADARRIADVPARTSRCVRVRVRVRVCVRLCILFA